jgi:hypothetical protein
MGIVEEEADESSFWLDIITETGNASNEKVEPLLSEARELTAIFTASSKTLNQTGENKFINFPIPKFKNPSHEPAQRS